MIEIQHHSMATPSKDFFPVRPKVQHDLLEVAADVQEFPANNNKMIMKNRRVVIVVVVVRVSI